MGGEDRATVPVVDLVEVMLTSLFVPGADVDARPGGEDQLTTRMIDGEAGGDEDHPVLGVDRHAQTPHRARSVQPGIVQPDLATVVRLIGREVIDPHEHAGVVVVGDERVRRGRRIAAGIGRAAGRGHRGCLLWDDRRVNTG